MLDLKKAYQQTFFKMGIILSVLLSTSVENCISLYIDIGALLCSVIPSMNSAAKWANPVKTANAKA